MGYAGSNYRVLDQSGRVFVSRDVIFDEGVAHRSMAVGETELETTAIPSSNTAPTTSTTTATETTPTPDVPAEPTLR